MPQNKDTPFKFELPSDGSLFSSYKGKHANITYTVKATADIANRFDVNKEEYFSVVRNNNTVFSPSIEQENRQVTTISDTAKNESNSLSLSPTPKEENADIESYSTRFAQIFGKKSKSNSNINSENRYRSRSFTFSRSDINFGFGSVFTKEREHFLKENSEARIDLLNNNNTRYSAGHLVRGNVILLSHNQQKEEERNGNKRNGNYFKWHRTCRAQGLERVSRIEKYETKIELGENEGNHFDDNKTIPFEIQIRNNMYQSYTGKYSEYFWGFEAKLNIAWFSDINARTIIEVV